MFEISAVNCVTLLLLLQAVMMAVDELCFHRRRGLGRFERWSHPADTLLYAGALIVPATRPMSDDASSLFISLGVASTLLITKDEWVHAEQCDGGEQWLHAMLFVIHPIALIAVYRAWATAPYEALDFNAPWGILAFMVYQIVYWVVVRDWSDKRLKA